MSDSDTEFDYDVPFPKSSGVRLEQRIGLPYVGSIADLDTLVTHPLITGGEEFSFALEFSPWLVDASSERGFFPMAINLGVPVLAILVDKQRCVLPLQVSSPAAVCGHMMIYKPVHILFAASILIVLL